MRWDHLPRRRPAAHVSVRLHAGGGGRHGALPPRARQLRRHGLVVQSALPCPAPGAAHPAAPGAGARPPARRARRHAAPDLRAADPHRPGDRHVHRLRPQRPPAAGAAQHLRHGWLRLPSEYLFGLPEVRGVLRQLHGPGRKALVRLQQPHGRQRRYVPGRDGHLPRPAAAVLHRERWKKLGRGGLRRSLAGHGPQWAAQVHSGAWRWGGPQHGRAAALLRRGIGRPRAALAEQHHLPRRGRPAPPGDDREARDLPRPQPFQRVRPARPRRHVRLAARRRGRRRPRGWQLLRHGHRVPGRRCANPHAAQGRRDGRKHHRFHVLRRIHVALPRAGLHRGRIQDGDWADRARRGGSWRRPGEAVRRGAGRRQRPPVLGRCV